MNRMVREDPERMGSRYDGVGIPKSDDYMNTEKQMNPMIRV